jgi:8-oxo-dGTP pyrophosphatase MutT (NUDIX family)/phage portal protein BeeE
VGWMERAGLRKANTTTVEAATTEGERQGMGNSPFSPMMPLRPMQGVGGQPKLWDTPAGFNTQNVSNRGDGRMSFSALKGLTDNYDVASMCIAHRINDIRSLEWNIVPAEGLDSNVEKSIEIARRLMKKPDRQTPFNSWLAMYLEDVLRYDAGTLYKRRDRAGRIYGLEVVSGTTMAPLLDGWGRRPVEEAPAFAQYIQGNVSKWFTSDEIIYQPFRPQPDSPYGIAPLESVLLPANTDVRFQMHFLNYFTSGTVPEGFIVLPESASNAAQMNEFQDLYDAWFYGDETKKRGMRVLPNETSIIQTKDTVFDIAFPMFLLKKVCAAYNVTPADLGFTDDVNKSSGDSQADVQFRTGVLPLVRHIEGLLTSFLQDDLGLPVEFQFDTARDSEDKYDTARADEIHIRNGVVSVDEVRELRYGKPINADEPTQRFIVAAGVGIVPLSQLTIMSGPTDSETLDADPNGAPAAPPALPGAAGGQEAITTPHGATPAQQAPLALTAGPVPGAKVDQSASTPTAAPGSHLTPEVLQHLFKGQVKVASAAIKAIDTGRVLMIQRTLDPEDPAAGTWEFPGGHLDPGEDPVDAATREWSEESGLQWPADAAMSGEWSSPDGSYVGLIFKVPAEASIPINTGDGEDGETLAWFDPAHLEGFPALRAELAAQLPAEELAKAMRRELQMWRSNTRSRLKRGDAPRRFDGEHLSTDLVDGIYAVLKSAATEDAANTVFDAAIGATAGGFPKVPTPPSWRDSPPVTTPYHSIDLPLTDHYTPLIREALGGTLTHEQLVALIGAQHPQVASTSLASALTQNANPEPLAEVLNALWAESYRAGDSAARVQMGIDVTALDGFAPGLLGPMPTGLSWTEAIVRANIELRGVTNTTMNKLGGLIVDGLADGVPVQKLARDLTAYLKDGNRAELIAHTEMARMATLGSEAAYRQQGISEWNLVISSGACPVCVDIFSRNPHRIGDSGSMPPVHPRCRCAMAPVETTIRNPFEPTEGVQ